MTRPVRLHRSELAVPGSSARMLERAPTFGADIVMLDLEDSVAPNEKRQARENVINALDELDWAGASLSVRVNALDTPWCYRDLVDVLENAGHTIDTVTIPKVGSPADVEFVATLLRQIEETIGLERPLGISILIETAAGMASVEQIAQAAPERLESMVFGVADYAASVQSHTTSIGGSDPGYAVLAEPDRATKRQLHLGDQWHYALSRIAVACRANGLRPIDGPFGDFADVDGYVAACRRAAVLGFEGKWAIHPSQVPLANEVFTPGDDMIERTGRIIAALRDAASAGKGAVSLDGRLIDAASVRMAENLQAKLAQIDQVERTRHPRESLTVESPERTDTT